MHTEIDEDADGVVEVNAPWSDADLLLGLSETATSGLAADGPASIRLIGRSPGQIRHFFQEGSEEFVLGTQ